MRMTNTKLASDLMKLKPNQTLTSDLKKPLQRRHNLKSDASVQFVVGTADSASEQPVARSRRYLLAISWRPVPDAPALPRLGGDRTTILAAATGQPSLVVSAGDPGGQSMPRLPQLAHGLPTPFPVPVFGPSIGHIQKTKQNQQVMW
jgi:hypothetical protein